VVPARYLGLVFDRNRIGNWDEPTLFYERVADGQRYTSYFEVSPPFKSAKESAGFASRQRLKGKRSKMYLLLKEGNSITHCNLFVDPK